MALIKCYECGKEISDKATACPGCGCPVKQPADYSRYSKEELWQKAYNIQYKQSKDNLPEAIDIYRHIINSFSGSAEAGYAQKQLEIIGVVAPANDPVKASVKQEVADNNRPPVSVYAYQSSPGTTYPSNSSNMPDIPTGLYLATGILGMPFGTGVALGCYIGAKSRIRNGDYDKAQKYINSTKVACWIILALCALIIMTFFGMLSSLLRGY